MNREKWHRNLAFFNVAAGGTRGGFRLLSASNLDWGQDMPALRDWHKSHADAKLALCYIGTPDPRYYGIHYICLPGGDADPDQTQLTGRRLVYAFSAVALQGVRTPTHQDWYRKFQEQHRLIAVLGGSIYLFEGP